MQLKGKKILIISTVLMYFATFLLQSNLEFFKVWAGETNKPRVNIVAVLVDDTIYGSIKGEISGYASYIQQKLSDTKALVLPLHLSSVSAYDIYRMMENIYFDGLKDVNSSLIGLVMIGDIPLPVVNNDGYVFPTVYPYVDFENQKYVWDSKQRYFVPNGNTEGQAEVWHGLINYGSNIQDYVKFFQKVKKYASNPDDFIGDAMWYEDFIADKEGFLNENYQYYRNKLMFSEDLGYQRHSPLMKSLVAGESSDNGVEVLNELYSAAGGGENVWDGYEIPSHAADAKHSTKMIQQELKDSFLSDYNDLFSKVELTTKRENIFAGGRWIKTYDLQSGGKTMEVDADSSASMIQLKDTLYGGNDNLVGIIQNFNNLLERFVDKKIEEEKYSMDMVIPIEYKEVKGKRAYVRCYPFVTRYENYYFGRNARYVDNVDDLSIYRGTYRNLTSIDGLQYKDLLTGGNPAKSKEDDTDITLKSVGASYDIFSNQADANRGYIMLKLEHDFYSEYEPNRTVAQDEEKTTCLRGLCTVRRKSWPHKCGEDESCESLEDFTKRWWGGASILNLDLSTVNNLRYGLGYFKATDAWRPIFEIAGFQSLIQGEDEGMTGTGWIEGSPIGPQWAATGYKAYQKYASPTQVEGWNKARWGYRVFENNIPNVHTGFVYSLDGDHQNLTEGWKFRDYWELPENVIQNWKFRKDSEKYFSISHKDRGFGFSCEKSERYIYKFVSSVVKHVSTTDDQINGIDRDLYGESGRLGKYYADVLLAYSGLYQDTLDIVASGHSFVEALSGKVEEMSGYRTDLVNAFSGLDQILNDDIDNSEQWGEIEEQAYNIESEIPEALSGVEEILSGSRNDFMQLYMSLSSLFADNIQGLFERIVYLELGDPSEITDENYSNISTKVPFLSSWISKINSIKDLIMNMSKSLLEAYDDAYTALDNFRSQRTDFYDRYQDSIAQLPTLNGRIEQLNDGFVNIFRWDVEIEEDDEEVVNMPGDENVDIQEPEKFVVLTKDSAKEVVGDFMEGFENIHKLFGEIFGTDQRGNKIITEALKDKDFNQWASDNSVDVRHLTQAELITEYARWAEGPGYDSDGARKNHELLVGVVEHMDGMNILTSDRPIDSPRYVSMQSIGAEPLKLIYPDLFKVEVFELTGENIHILYTGGQIKENLVEYLTNKAKEYNTILDVSPDEDSPYYRKIFPYDEFATPYGGRPYKDFQYEEFVDALGGEQTLDMIADILYYQNLTNKKKLTSNIIEEDMAYIKKSFNINDKREYVLEDYLTEGREQEKNPLIVIPKYELSGYEVAYVNSNGGDYIIPTESITDDTPSQQEKEILTPRIVRVQPSDDEEDFKDKCKIPKNGKLPIFKLEGLKATSPWFDGFMCWVEETLNKPLEVKLSFDGSIGEIFKRDIKDEDIKDPEDKNYTKWKDDKVQTADARESLVNPGTGFDADKIIGELELMAERHNAEVLGKDSGASNALSDLSKNIKISNSNGVLSDNKPDSLLEISSIVNAGNITVTIEGTGDGCLKINETTVCDGSKISKTFNPKTSPFTGIVSSADNKAGVSALDIKYSLGNGGDYIEKVVKYRVSPSVLVSAKITLGDEKTVAGMITPVEVKGFDQYNNEVGWGLEKFDFKVSQGRFLKDGSFMTGFTTNDFRNLEFYYQAPLDAKDGSEAIIEIVESNEFKGEKIPEPLATHHQRIVQGNVEVKLNDVLIINGKQTKTDQEYKLSDEETIYNSQGKVDVSKLQKIELDIKDMNGKLMDDLDSQIVVTSQNGLLVMGQLQKNEKGENIFFTTNMHYLSGGHVDIYYYPTKVAGEDIIEIEIPGLESRIINLNVRPSSLTQVQFKTSDKILQIGKEMTIEAFLMDKWGNLIDTDGAIAVRYDPDKVDVPGGKDGVVVVGYSKGYAKFTAIGIGGGLCYISTNYGSINIVVDKHLFPNSGLNVLYLNYFGNDWGNQWGYFSDNDNYVENVMRKSNKVIATTTQIVSEDKIKKMLWKIQPGFQIQNLGNQKTVLSFHGKSIDMSIGEISSMHSSIPFSDWTTVTLEGMETLVQKTPNTNYMFFIPSNSIYSVKDGILYSGDKKLGIEKIGSIVDGEIPLQLSDSTLDNGDNVWNVVNRGITYGSVVLHIPSFVPNLSNFVKAGDRYLINNTFTDGSTYTLSSVGFFDKQSNFELDSSYKSIQNSDELKEQIGFLGEFKNITLFAEGEIVGEAARKFGSEFVINLGDPVLSRKGNNENVYGTEYDGGIGQEIYADSEDDIFGTYQIDFNSDGLKDLLVVYLNGAIKLAKNYGGTPDMRNLQELMHIAVSIEDVFIGDVDGNGYEDIIIRTSNNQIRVYKNNEGVFDVDGSLACLNIGVPEGGQGRKGDASDISELYQFEVEDMDKDKRADIITYDHAGYVKVFYGGKTLGGDNYLSKEKYGCDTGWYLREAENTTVVAQVGLNIANGEKIFDNSMLRRVGMVYEPLVIHKPDLCAFGICFNEDILPLKIEENQVLPLKHENKIAPAVGEVLLNTDIDQASETSLEAGMKYRDVSLYENKLVGGDGSDSYVFVPLSFLQCTDKAYAYKTYSYKGGQLRDGDKVTVTVHIEAQEPVVVTFGDIIQGPWRLYFDNENYFKGLKIPEGKNVQLKQRDGNFAYLLDNISLGGGESFSYSYELEYAGLKIRDMALSYDAVWAPPYSNDNYPDIKMQSIDGCDKDFNAFLNMGASRKFSNQKIGLQGLIDGEYAKTEAKTYDSSSEVAGSNSKTVNDWPGIVGNTINRIELLGDDDLEISNDAIGRTKLRDVLLQKIQNGSLAGLNIGLDVNLAIFERQTEQIENVVDEITKGMCEGFTFGGSNNCEGLPVPFNQAFFAPGKYHLFGCWDLPIYKLDKGLPVFFFPGTDPVPPYYPVPNGLKGAGDQFVWVGGGGYPSMIRIYAAPTLTAQLGIAVCLGSYGAGYGLPSPLSDVAGNCVVFAVKPQCKGSSGNGEVDSQNPNETYPAITEDVKDTKTCSQSEKGIQITKNGERSSPFNLGGSFFGIVELEMSALIGPADGSDVENSITIGDVEVLGGKYDVNKIKGGIQQGLRQILIDKWLDPQIRYIVNQLTKMHINIKLPNIANLIGYEAQVLDNVTKSFNKEENTEEEEQSINGPVADPTGDKKTLSKAISAWKSISHERLNEFNDQIANPFEALTSLLNQSNIINITTEPLTVKVPFIMSDDITAYELYLKQWLDENKKILNEWDRIISALAGSCSKNPETYQQCMKEANEYRASLIEFEGIDWKKMENQIYTNLLILQEYRNFPFEMYEWIHVVDRYVSEIASLISNTIGYLSYWTSTNAERFVGYVDAIVLMLNIIKTYQIIIDFSVEWSENCGNCARDTYDQYSCKLSLLCNGLSLPIIQIPNFKLPNITIDLTDIDLGLDIVLPSFNFQTVRVDLPELPNLPHPPAIGAKIKLFDLPNIPTLPEPPHLPELPSFIPEVELKLPILPPAPELPELPNTIESLIRVAEMIGKIYCIVKGKFGMVGESSVKAKIEQLTQRTYTVDWIDNIMDFTNVTAAPIRNYGVDYEIASHVDIQFNLSTFYSFLDYLTTNINNLTTKVVKETQEGINSTAEGVFSPASDISESIEGTKIGVEATLFGPNGIVGKNVLPSDEIVEGIVSDDVKYVDYSSAKKRLEEVLTYFRKEGRNTTLTDKLNSAIDKIENQISTPNVIEANNEGIDKIRNQALAYLDGRKSEYSGLADMINNDYEGFLTMIDSQNYKSETKSSLNSGKLLTFNVNLFNLDSSAEENLKKLEKENPYTMILDNKQAIVDGYWKAINKNSADDLGLTQKQYLVLHNDIANMKKQLSNFYSVTRPVSSTNLVAKNGGGISNTTLMASANAAEVAVSKPVKELSVDPSNFAQGIYEKIISGPDAGRLAKVVYADSFVSMIGDNNYKTSPAQGHDILMWTDNAVFKKCTAQVCGGNGKHIGGSYMLSKSIDKIPYERKTVTFDADTVLKIADGDLEVKNWKVKGQTYDSFTLSWKLESVDAYLIKLSTRIDTSYEKSDIKNRDTRYILVLPDGVNEEDLIKDKYKLEILGEKIETIKSLLAGKQVVEVVHYDKNKAIASIIVSGPEARMWYYANIASLKLNDKTYNINSPWSNQIVAGRQIAGDEQEPSAEPYLYRKKLDKIVSVGDDLEGYVSTYYKLKVPWKDNVALSYVNISQDGKILAEEYTNKPEFTLEVDGLFKTESLKEVYNSVGIDQFGNKTEKVITVAYYIPTIEITDISESDGESLAITAQLSHGMDQGNVSFQRRRDETWKTMKKKDSECADLSLALDQTTLVGKPYSLGNKIAFYNASDAVVALIDPETAEVVVQDEFKDSYEVKVGVNDAAVIKVCNKQTNKTEFNLSIPTEELLKVEVGKAYTLVDLSGAQNMGMYNGGKAVNKDGNNVLLVSPTGHLYSSVSLEGGYEYDKGLKAVVITLYLPSDTAKKNPIKVRVKAQPMNM